MITRFKKFTKANLRQMMLNGDFNPNKVLGGFIRHTPSPMEELLILCQKVARRDTFFQNLNSERDDAKREAQNTLLDAQKIKTILENIRPEDANMALQVLNTMDIMYLRVFGDQLAAIPFEGTNLEEWVKRECKSKALQEMAKNEDYVDALFKAGFGKYQYHDMDHDYWATEEEYKKRKKEIDAQVEWENKKRNWKLSNTKKVG